MEIINPGDNRITQMIAKPYKDNQQMFHLSDRCVLYRDTGYSKADIYMLKNMLTGQVVFLNEHEFSVVSGLRDHPVNMENLDKAGIRLLADSQCIVAVDRDEFQEYLSLIRIFHLMKKTPEGYENYIIFPTTGCNARCVYCFEEDYIPRTMTEQTARETAAFISRTKRNGTIKLKWFGGEPLAAASRINLICQELENRQVDFTSSIVTNATMMTPELADKAKNLWHLTKAQVSLDGNRENYETRKRYLNPQLYHYEKAKEGIRLLKDLGIDVDLRCNFDKENIAGIREFIRDIYDTLGPSPRLRIYFSPLYQALAREDAPELIRQIRTMEVEAEALGFRAKRENPQIPLRLNFCMADDLKRNVVIDPEGFLQSCEHLQDENRFGNVWNGITDSLRYDVLCITKEAEKECKHCPFLPKCTVFSKKGCPLGIYQNCRQVKQAKEENRLFRIAVAYKNEKRKNQESSDFRK